jgi:hypothetical protein
VIKPPENARAPVSDEDSGDEDGTINNLPGSLLRAPAYLVQDGYDAESDSDDLHTHLKANLLKFHLRLLRSNLLHQTESDKNCSQKEKS